MTTRRDEDTIRDLIAAACEAEYYFSLDELEEFAAQRMAEFAAQPKRRGSRKGERK